MQRIYSSLNLFMVENAHNLLELQGIKAEVRNSNLSGASGELPPLQCEPELWLMNDADLERALQILAESGYGKDQPVVGPDWTCGHCRDVNPDSFDVCWKCGQSR